MKLSVGDEVRFLNATGGGVVSAIIDSKTVRVMTSDGFELPTLTADLVRIGSNQAAARFFGNRSSSSPPVPSEHPADESGSDDPGPEDHRMTTISPAVTLNRKQEEVMLAFVPHDQKWLITGQVDILLINNTGQHILYSLFHRNSLAHAEGIDYGSVLPDSVLLMDTVNHEQLGRWTDGCIQLLFHADQQKMVLPPFHADFRIEGKKFFREGAYRESRFFTGKGLIMKVVSLEDLRGGFSSGPVSAPGERPSGATEPSDIMKHQTGPREAEVDLHIHELVEDHSFLEKNEILDFQMNYFRKCLDSARAHHFLKVTFIHGIGNGVLRQNIVTFLEKEEGIIFHDAPMSKYGAGAIEVRIPHNS